MTTGFNAEYKSGTGTPTAALVDGSVYNQLDSGGAMFLRVSATWKQLLVAGGAVALFTAGSLGQMLQTGSGPTTQWSTDFNVQPYTPFGGTWTGMWMGEGLTTGANTFLLVTDRVNGTILNAPGLASGYIGFSVQNQPVAWVSRDAATFGQSGISFDAGLAYTLGYMKQQSDIATRDLTIQAQAPFATAVTNTAPGSLIFNVPAPVGTPVGVDAFGKIRFQFGGTNYVTFIRGSTGAPTSAFMWMGTTAVTSTNWTIQSDGDIAVRINAANGSVNPLASVGFQVAGATTLFVTATALEFQQTQAASMFHRTRASDAATFDFTIGSQAPFATATLTNRNPGNLVLSVPAPVAGGADGFVKVSTSGHSNLWFGLIPGAPTFGVIWANNAITPTASNYALAGNGTALNINAPVGSMFFNINDVVQLAMADAAHDTYAVPAGLSFYGTVTIPRFGQRPPLSDLATTDLIIQSQPPFQTATTFKTAGNLILATPAPIAGGSDRFVKVSTSGAVSFDFGYVPTFGAYPGIFMGTPTPSATNWIIASDGTATTDINSPSATSYVGIANGGTDLIFFARSTTPFGVRGAFFAFDLAYTLGQQKQQSDAVTVDLTVSSQAPFATATGTNRNPGNILLSTPAPTNGGIVDGFIKVINSTFTAWTFGYRFGTPAGVNTPTTIYGGTTTPNGTNHVFAFSPATAASGGAGTDFCVMNGPGTSLARTDNPGVGTSGAAVRFSVQNLNIARMYFDGFFFAAGDAANSSTTTGYTIGQLTGLTDIPANDLTISSQKPYSAATLTNRNPGNLVLSIPSPISGGNPGFVKMSVSGATMAQFGYYDTTGSMSSPNWGAIWLEKNETPTHLNYAISAGDNTTWINSNGGGIGFGHQDTMIAFVQHNFGWRWAIDVDGYFGFINLASDLATQRLTLEGHRPYSSATGTNRNSGPILITTQAPAGAGTAGSITMQVSATDTLVLNTATKATWFNAFSLTSGTASPAASEVDGSLYVRTGSPNGDLFVRRNSLWVSVFSGSGFVPTSRNILTTGVLGGGGDLSADRTLSVVGGTNGFVLAWTGGVPTWQQIVDANVASVGWSKITGTPTTLAGYGITDAVPAGRTLQGTAPIQIAGDNAAHDLSVNRIISIVNATTGAVGVIQLAQDLGGTGALPTVIALTGTATVVAMHGRDILWDQTAGAPRLRQTAAAAATSGNDFTVQAQDGGSGNSAGGNVQLIAGLKTGVGTPGQVNLQAGGGIVAMFSPSKATLVAVSLFWDAGTGLAGLNQEASVTGNGNAMKIIAQAGWSTGVTNGGDLWLVSGAKNSSGIRGSLLFKIDTITAATFAEVSATETSLTFNSTRQLLWASSMVNPLISQVSTASGNGNFLEIVAQTTTDSAGNRNGGTIAIGSGAGAGSGVAGDVNFRTGGNTRLALLPATSRIHALWSFEFDAGMTTATITQESPGSGNGQVLTVLAQAGVGSNKNGGRLDIFGGEATGTGLRGGFRLGLGGVPELTSSIMAEGATVLASSRVLALCFGNAVTSTHVPSGDRVIAIGDCGTVPTTPPSAGRELLFSSGGALYAMGPSGFITQLSVA